MSEYIGSRISLISKSDIKYIGTLHEINSDTHTVALESVTSFGTEGRKGNPSEEIPGSDQVYEYIVFRGSDVKELTIVAPPGGPKENERPKMPDDPAILGSARPAPHAQQAPPQPPQNQYRSPPPSNPPQQPMGFHGPPQNNFQGQPRFQGPGGPHGFPGQPGAVPGFGYGPPHGPPMPPYGMGYPPPPGQGFASHMPSNSFTPSPPPPYGHMQQHSNRQRLPQGPPGMSQGPVGNQGTTSQSSGQPTQAPAHPSEPVEMSVSPGLPTEAVGPPPPTASKPDAAANQDKSIRASSQTVAPGKPAQKVDQRVAIPLPPPHVLAAKPAQRPNAGAHSAAPGTVPAPQPQTFQDATEAATAAVNAAMAKLVNQDQGRPQSNGVHNLTQKVNQMRVHDGQQRGRGRGRMNGTRSDRRGSEQQAAVEVPKEDFDFQSSNAKFNKQELIKEAIATGYPIASPTSGEKTNAISATNGHTNDEAAEDIVIPPQPEVEKGYDKKSSFFDDISSDLKDRAAQSQQQATINGRAMRREERSKNMETFGQGSVDSGLRSGYRGRGRGRGFSRGGYRGRGGFDNRGSSRGRGPSGAAEAT